MKEFSIWFLVAVILAGVYWALVRADEKSGDDAEGRGMMDGILLILFAGGYGFAAFVRVIWLAIDAWRH